MITNHSTRTHRAGHFLNVRTAQGGSRMSTRPLSRAARRTLTQFAAMRSYSVRVTGGREASRNATLVKAVRAIGGQDLRKAKELLRWPSGFCYQCKTAEEAEALQRELVAAGAVCTVRYVDAYGRPVSEERASEAA